MHQRGEGGGEQTCGLGAQPALLGDAAPEPQLLRRRRHRPDVGKGRYDEEAALIDAFPHGPHQGGAQRPCQGPHVALEPGEGHGESAVDERDVPHARLVDGCLERLVGQRAVRGRLEVRDLRGRQDDGLVKVQVEEERLDGGQSGR